MSVRERLTEREGGERERERGSESVAYLVIRIGSRLEKVSTLPETHLQGHDEALTDGVDGRVSNLGEPLFEVIVEHVRPFAQYLQQRSRDETMPSHDCRNTNCNPKQ